MSGNDEARIVVLGSFMTDVISYVKKLPKVRETLSGHKLVICCGGKGANQAVTAARLGASTAFIGKVGDDSFGKEHMTALVNERIKTSGVSFTSEALTGVGQIVVEDGGQNCVVTVNGANDHLSIQDVQNTRDMIAKAKIMLCELTIPQQTVLAGLKLANELGVFTVLNAAPAVANVESAFYSLSDIFCVNETEAEIMTGLTVTSPEEALPAARRLMEKGCKKHVLITLGKNGALLLSRSGPSSYSEPIFVTAPKVQAVDTAGAGDCFLGSLAYFLAYHSDWSLEKTIAHSCRIASVSVQAMGTQPSFPHKDQLEASLFV